MKKIYLFSSLFFFLFLTKINAQLQPALGVNNASTTIASNQNVSDTHQKAKNNTSSLVDIALNKPATSSSDQDGTTPASNANDGDSTTRWSSLFEDPQWLQIDLGSTYSVDSVFLQWEDASGENFSIETSLDGLTWNTVSSVNLNTNLNNNFSIPNAIARFVRMYGVTRTTAYGYSLYEFQVFGIPDNEIDIALNKPATSSSDQDGTTPASNANDGNPTTRWSSLFEDPQWLQIDLGSTYSVDSVFLQWEDASGENFSIETSLDGLIWNTVASVNLNTSLNNNFSIPNAIARFVRMYGVTRTTAYGYSLYEFKVFGVPKSTTGIQPLKNGTNNNVCYYPNPVCNKITITHPDLQASTRIQVLNMKGQVVKDERINQTNQLDVNSLENGVYLLNLSINGVCFYNSKFVVLK